jgi:hypothetical protein
VPASYTGRRVGRDRALLPKTAFQKAPVYATGRCQFKSAKHVWNCNMLITSKIPQLIILFSVYLIGRYIIGVEFVIYDYERAHNLVFWSFENNALFLDERGVILNIFDYWIGLFKTRDGIIDIEFGPWGVIASLLMLLYPVIFIWEGEPKDD